jgi:maltooligosyltrehalose trehalohydrolase
MDDFHHALYTLIDPARGRKLYADFGKMDQLAKAYKDGFVHSGEYVNFRKRKFGTSSAGIPGNKFVVFIDNHDQAGNRLTGDCLSSLITYEWFKLASAAYLLSPYIPMLFMGEEYGDDSPFLYFISHEDQDLVELVRKGRKEEFEHFDWENDPPDPYDEETFQQSKLQWNRMGERKHRAIHDWYKKLIHLRKTHPALKSFSKNDTSVNSTDFGLQLHRRSECGKDEIVSFFNFSETSSFPCTLPSPQCWSKIIDSNDPRWLLDQSEYEPLPLSIQPGGNIIIPPLTIVGYTSE